MPWAAARAPVGLSTVPSCLDVFYRAKPSLRNRQGNPLVKLARKLSLLDVFCIASGAMISSGLFVLPVLAFTTAGPGVVLSYFLAGLLAMAGMLSQAELVSALPKAGGTYFYVMRSMGPAVGTVNGLITWLSLTFKSAFALVGIGAFAVILFPAFNVQVVALLVCMLFIGINLVGIKQAGRVQVGLVIGLLALLLLYIVRGLPAVEVPNLDPFMPEGLPAVFFTAGLVFVSYGGLVKVASIAEEVKNPARTVPLGMFLSLLVVSVLYVLVVFVTVGTGALAKSAAMEPQSMTPISDAAVFMGSWGPWLLGIAAMLAFISTANAGLMAASRYPLAASRDGLLPSFFESTNRRFKTPHVAILMTGALMVAALFFELKLLAETASCALILTFMLSCVSVIMMRLSRLQNYQPRFRSPLFPWVQIVGIVGYGFLLFQMGFDAVIASGVLVAVGLFTYWFYGRIKEVREYALLHLIQRVTAKELVTGTLEDELKQIIRERDEIQLDRFDNIIERCLVLDLDESMSSEAFFKLVAERMKDRLKVEPSVLLKLLVEREKESSTVFAPHLAIPHIILKGEHAFDILLARSKKGIVFSEDFPAVHSAFVLVGTKDERNYHLQVLAAIAQIVQDPGFTKKWLAARNEQALRDIVLLGKRRRD